MRIIAVPVLADNYAYLIISSSGKAAVVDPAGPEAVLAKAGEELAEITMVLTTHRHWDHAGGNEQMAKLCPDITIVGGANDQIPAVTQTVTDGETLMLGDDVRITVIDTPYHTSGHVCYLCEDVGPGRLGGDPPALFSGDTLFIAGVGRCFSGDFEAMQATLQRLTTLPPATQVYCGHEYTVPNLLFAATVEPDNEAVQRKLEWARSKRSHRYATVPSTIQEELLYNPFLRCTSPAVMAFTGRTAPLEVLAELRRKKDTLTAGSAAVTWGIRAMEGIYWLGYRLGLTRRSFLS